MDVCVCVAHTHGRSFSSSSNMLDVVDHGPSSTVCFVISNDAQAIFRIVVWPQWFLCLQHLPFLWPQKIHKQWFHAQCHSVSLQVTTMKSNAKCHKKCAMFERALSCGCGENPSPNWRWSTKQKHVCFEMTQILTFAVLPNWCYGLWSPAFLVVQQNEFLLMLQNRCQSPVTKKCDFLAMKTVFTVFAKNDASQVFPPARLQKPCSDCNGQMIISIQW